MGIYIVRPKLASATRAVGLISRRLKSDQRQKQIAEVQSFRDHDPTYQTMRKWIGDADQQKVGRITHETDTPVTGTTLVNMPDEEADRMRQENPDLLVVRDQPIDLISPKRTTTTAKTKVTSSDLWHLKAIGLSRARQHGFKGTGGGVTVCVLDTGVDPSHPELAGKVSGAYTFDVAQWQAVPMAPSHDTDGHGTHVAGLICGKTVGIAPGASVVNGVMLPGGRGNLSDFILALEWTGHQENVPVVNMSAGIPGYLPEMRAAVSGLLSVGVLPVFATGNEGRNRTRSPGNYIEPVSVGASDRRGKVAGFSSGGMIVTDNHQYQVPDLVAPGAEVYSSVVGGSYEAWDGTSMATPIVSGTAALILEKYPDITVTDLIEELLSTCKDLGEEADRQGKGMVQVKAAL
jgi:subtilisin family serine protease